jgi:hypothetical protein
MDRHVRPEHDGKYEKLVKILLENIKGCDHLEDPNEDGVGSKVIRR